MKLVESLREGTPKVRELEKHLESMEDNIQEHKTTISRLAEVCYCLAIVGSRERFLSLFHERFLSIFHERFLSLLHERLLSLLHERFLSLLHERFLALLYKRSLEFKPEYFN